RRIGFVPGDFPAQVTGQNDAAAAAVDRYSQQVTLAGEGSTRRDIYQLDAAASGRSNLLGPPHAVIDAQLHPKRQWHGWAQSVGGDTHLRIERLVGRLFQQPNQNRIGDLRIVGHAHFIGANKGGQNTDVGRVRSHAAVGADQRDTKDVGVITWIHDRSQLMMLPPSRALRQVGNLVDRIRRDLGVAEYRGR